MTEIEEKKEQLKYMKEQCLQSYTTFKRSQTITKSLQKDWEEKRDAYEALDRELAEIDGRKKIYQLGAKKAEKVSLDLTDEQIRMIAAKLGITLEKTENDELDFETEE